MPNFFAHYLHGQYVLNALPKDVHKRISNKKLFEIGLQGPDIFYPYKAITFPNSYKINKLGGKIHKKPCMKFMENLFKNTEVSPTGDLFSYVCGFICHFSLDSVCHPYIDGVAEKNDFTHGEIETEFDRVLLELHGYDPVKTKLSDMITLPDVKSKSVKEMSKAFKGYKKITPKVMARTLKDFKRFKRLFYSPSKIKQRVLLYVCQAFMLKNIYNSCVMRTKVNPKSFITNTGLIYLFTDCIGDSCELIANFSDHIVFHVPLSKKFERCFV